MFCIGDSFIYGSNGICELIDIEDKMIQNEKVMYYVFKPVFTNVSTIYVPVDNKKLTAKLRPLLSPPEVYALIDQMPYEGNCWIDDERQRKECYKEMIEKGNHTELLQLIKSIFFHQEDLKKLDKKLHISDERFMKEAEKMLYDEFAYVLNIDRNHILSFIKERVSAKNHMNQTF